MDHVRIEVEGRIAVLTIDNPPVNAISSPVRAEIRQGLTDLETNDEVWAVILTGGGQKIFVAGADMTEFPPLRYASAVERGRVSRAWWDYIAHYSKPLICAINGHALGGGLELALCCDIRVAASNARVGLPEAAIGVMPGGGGTQRLPRLVGSGLAKLMIFAGEQVTAADAQQAGLVEKVVAQEELLPACKAIAEKIIARSPLAVRMAKQAINQGFELPLSQGLDFEAECFARLMDTEDKNEGVGAFLEKRSPEWKAR